jgi:glycosyltransferase involved in cell wall biosynthesis
MNILIASSTFPRWPNDAVPDFVWQQAVHLHKSFPELKIFILAPHDEGAKRTEEWDGIKIFRFRYFFPSRLERLVYPAIWPNIKRNPLLVLLIPFLILTEFISTFRLVRSQNIKLVYSHWFLPQAIACGLAARILGVPHVLTTHSSDVQVMGKLPVIGRLIVRSWIRQCKAVSAVSRRSLAKLRAFFSDAEWEELSQMAQVIPMGVDLEAWRHLPMTGDKAREKHGIPPGLVLLFMGRLAEKKGLDYLLEALAAPEFQLPQSQPTLIIAGDGPLRVRLRKKCAQLGLSDMVRFVGYVQGQEKRDYFAAADVLVLPSIITSSGDAEGLPVVLVEGLASGNICVASDASGADDIIVDGVNGFLVPQKDAVALRGAIMRCAQLSPEEKDRMCNNAVETAKRFDWQTIATRHFEHLIR